MASERNVLLLFDVDGTLTPARRSITPDLKEYIKNLRKRVVIGVVGGSDLAKQREQLGDDVTEQFDYSFSENGLVAYHNNKLVHQRSIKDLGEDYLKKIINFLLRYFADLDIPIKRGTFIEFRTGMLNASPIGRNCNQEERDAFAIYDKQHGVLKALAATLREKFPELTTCIGGQISVDIFPKGWDKTYCLQHVKNENFKEIHFFGDKTSEGGNDYEIYSSDLTIGHTVKGPDDTLRLLKELFS